MFPTPRLSQRLLRALDVAVDFATLGEVRVEAGAPWLDDKPLRREWFADEAGAPSAGVQRRAGNPSTSLKPATAAGRAAAAAARAALPPACAGARHTQAERRRASPPRRKRVGEARPRPQPCLWAGDMRQ